MKFIRNLIFLSVIYLSFLLDFAFLECRHKKKHFTRKIKKHSNKTKLHKKWGIGGLLNSAGKAVNKVGQGLKNAENAVNRGANAVNNAVNKSVNAVNNAIVKTANTVNNAIETGKQAYTKTKQAVNNAIVNTASAFDNAVESGINSFNEGLQGKDYKPPNNMNANRNRNANVNGSSINVQTKSNGYNTNDHSNQNAANMNANVKGRNQNSAHMNSHVRNIPHQQMKIKIMNNRPQINNKGKNFNGQQPTPSQVRGLNVNTSSNQGSGFNQQQIKESGTRNANNNDSKYEIQYKQPENYNRNEVKEEEGWIYGNPMDDPFYAKKKQAGIYNKKRRLSGNK